jgi:hypothetical protein
MRCSSSDANRSADTPHPTEGRRSAERPFGSVFELAALRFTSPARVPGRFNRVRPSDLDWRVALTSFRGAETLGIPLQERWICGLSSHFYTHFALSPS